MKKNKLVLPDYRGIAEQIIAIENEIQAFEEPVKQLKLRKEELRERMIHALKENRLNSFQTESDVGFSLAYRSSLEITDEKKALEWGFINQCIKVDTVKANRVLKGAGALPEGFVQAETEHLVVTGLNKK